MVYLNGKIAPVSGSYFCYSPHKFATAMYRHFLSTSHTGKDVHLGGEE